LMLYDGCTAGGGNSLFISLHKLLMRIKSNFGSDHINLRKRLINELLLHADKYKIKLDRNARRILRSMLCDDVLPTLDSLLAASKIFNVEIHVYFWSNTPVIYKVGDHNDIIHLQCLGGFHFNALVSLHNYETPNAKSCTMVTLINNQLLLNSNCEAVDDFLESENSELCNLDINPISECIHTSSKLPSSVLKILVEGTNFCAIIDTGAQMNLVSESMLQTLRNDQTDPDITVKHICDIVGLTGIRIPITQTTHLKLSLSPMIETGEFTLAVVPESVFPICFLLGLTN